MKLEFSLINEASSFRNDKIINSLSPKKIDDLINSIKSQLAHLDLYYFDNSKIKKIFSVFVNELVESSNIISQKTTAIKKPCKFQPCINSICTLNYLQSQINHLFNHLQKNYQNYFDCNVEAPNSIRTEAILFISESIPVIEKHFLKLKINATFSHCMLQPLRELARNTHHHHTLVRISYLRKHCKKLLDFCNSPFPITDHNLVLCKILIEENYNYTNFLNSVCKFIKHEVGEKLDPTSKLTRLEELRMLINQTAPNNNLGYSPNSTSAREYLLNFIQQLINFHENVRRDNHPPQSNSCENHEKIKLKLTLKQAACLFNVLFYCGLFHEDKTGVFISKIAANFQVNSDEDINPMSFSTYFYNSDPDIIESIKQLFLNFIKYLIQDNKLKYNKKDR